MKSQNIARRLIVLVPMKNFHSNIFLNLVLLRAIAKIVRHFWGSTDKYLLACLVRELLPICLGPYTVLQKCPEIPELFYYYISDLNKFPKILLLIDQNLTNNSPLNIY